MSDLENARFAEQLQEQILTALEEGAKKDGRQLPAGHAYVVTIDVTRPTIAMNHVECWVSSDVRPEGVWGIQNAMRMIIDNGFPHALVLRRDGEQILHVHAGAKASWSKAA